jgi:hypothetical protein
MEIRQAFRLLKLDPGAAPEVVKRRYHELAARWHPDRIPAKSPANPSVAEKMKELNAAYALIRSFYQAHRILFCARCGEANFRPKDVNLEYAACTTCGKQLQRATPRTKKTPCGNERCAGTIGSNGRCNYCGKTVEEVRTIARGEEGPPARSCFTRPRAFGRSAARIAQPLLLALVACGAVAAAYLFHLHRDRSAEPAFPVDGPSAAAPSAHESPRQRGEAQRAFFAAPAHVVVPEETVYIDLFKARTVSREEVIRLQRMLKTIGYPVEAIDGAAGNNTAAALRLYSGDFGYLPTKRFPLCFFESAALHHELASVHPDWLDIFRSGELGRWVMAQPERVRREIYAAAFGTPGAAVQLVRRYKFDRYKPLPKLLPETKILKSASPAAAASLWIRTPLGKHHYLVKLVDFEGRQEAAVGFVRGGTTLVARLPLGAYELRYASGEAWFGPECLFGPAAQYGRLHRLILLTEAKLTAADRTVELPSGASELQAAERISEFDF